MNLLEMGLAGSVLILLTLVLRALLVNRLPKRTFLALWAVAAARLLLPFQLPSRVSVYNAPQMPLRVRGTVQMFSAAPVSPDIVAGAQAARPALTGEAAAWLIGLCACALFFLVAYLRCRLALRDALPVQDARALALLRERPLRRKVRLLKSQRVRAPLSYGLLHPVVLMPADFDWSNERRARYVLAHELTHIRRFDGAAKFLLLCVLCAHWFNPLVWVMFAVANRDLELSCDEAVVRAFGEEAKSAYALALIGMEERKSRLTPLCNNFSKTAIEERIRAIMKLKKTTAAALCGALALVLCVTTVFATTPKGAPKTANAPRDARAAASMRQSVAPYAPFGLTVDDAGQMYYQGRPVRELYDEASGAFIANSLGTGYPEGALDLVAVYEGGELVGLAEADPQDYARRTEERQKVGAQRGPVVVDGRLPDGYAQAHYAELLALRPENVAEMSIAEYRAYIHRQAAAWPEDVLAQRIDAMTDDDLLQEAQFTDADAFFLMNTLRLTAMDNWRAWSVNLGGVVNDGEAAVQVDFTVEDADEALVGARDGAIADALTGMYELLGGKSAAEMADQDAVQNELQAMAQAAVAARASRALHFEVNAYYGYLGELAPQDDPASEPANLDFEALEKENRGEPADAGDYERMLALMDGYHARPVGDFSDALLRHMEDDPGFFEAYWRVYNDLAWSDEHYQLNDAQRSFLTLTLNASNGENAAMVKSDRLGYVLDPELAPVEITRRWTETLRGDLMVAVEATMYYALSYRVLDAERLTVGERDRRLAAVMRGMQVHFDSLDEEAALATTKADVRAWFEDLAALNGDDLMRIEAREDGYLGYQVYDQRDWVAQCRTEIEREEAELARQ